MADALTARLLVNLGGNLPAKAQQFDRSMARFSRNSRRSVGLLGASTATLGRGIDRLGSRYTALLTGAVGIGTARGVVNLQRRFTRLGIQANVSADKVELLKKRIFEVSQLPDIRIDPSQLTSAVETIVEKTGDLAFAEGNLENLARAIQATGGSGESLGALTAELKKFGIETNTGVAVALDTLVTQGKEGSFTLQNLASQGERLAAAYAATGRQGQTAVREIGAVIQTIKDGTSSGEQAATAFEALLRTFQDAEKVKLLQSGGIAIFEPDQPGVMRAINEIMADIIAKTKGDPLKISQVFDAEAMRAFNAAIGEFKNTGALASMERFLAIQGDGTGLMEDSGRAAKDFAGAMQTLSTAWQEFGDKNLAGPIQDLADALNSIEPERLQELLATAKNVGLGLGGLVLARKLGAGKLLGAGARRLMGGRGAPAGGSALPGLGGALGVGGAVPVLVTNWPVSLGAGPGGRRGGSVIGRHGNAAATGLRSGGLVGLGRGALGAAKIGARGFGPLLGLLSLFDLASTLSDSSLNTQQKVVGSGGAVGSFAGGLGGAAAGAAVGSAIPILGTAIGAAIGAALGAYGGDNIGERLTRLVIELNNAPPGTRMRDIEGDGGLDIELDTGIAMGVP